MTEFVLTQRYMLNLTYSKPSGSENKVHGWHYFLEVSLTSDIDSEFGLIVNRQLMNQTVFNKIIKIYDKKRLENHQLFSGEALAHHFLKILKNSEIGPFLKQVCLKEPENQFVSEV